MNEGASVGIERPEPGSATLEDLGLEVNNVVGGLGMFTVGVDSSDSLVGVRDRRDLVNLIGGSAGLDALQAASGRVVGLALGEVGAESEGDDLSDVGVGAEDAGGDAQALTRGDAWP